MQSRITRDHIHKVFWDFYPSKLFAPNPLFDYRLHSKTIARKIVSYIELCRSFKSSLDDQQGDAWKVKVKHLSRFVSFVSDIKFEDQSNILHVLACYDSSKVWDFLGRSAYNHVIMDIHLGIWPFATIAQGLVNSTNRYGQTPLMRALLHVHDVSNTNSFKSVTALIAIGGNLMEVCKNHIAREKFTELLKISDSFELEVMYGIMVQCAGKSERLLKRQALLVYQLKHGPSQEVDILQYLANLTYKSNNSNIGIINYCAGMENPFLEPEAVLAAAKLLVKNGCSLETKSHTCGSTALILASKYGNQKLAKLLIDHGADLSARNNKGGSSFDYALSRGDNTILAMLQGTNTQQFGMVAKL